MKLKIILSILFCLITNHIFAEVYVKELRDNSGRKIFYIDMVHVWMREYFDEVNKNVEDIFYSNKNPIILKEGIALCAQDDSSYYYRINTDSNYIPKIPLDHEIEYYKDNNLPFIQDMIANNFLKKIKCIKDIKHPYPSQGDIVIHQSPYLEEEFLKIKENDNVKFSILNDVFIDISNSSINADIVLSELPIFYKFLYDLDDINIDVKKKFFSEEEIVKLENLGKKILLDYRENQALLNIFNTFYIKNTDTIILPWGGDHYHKLARKLEEKGFKEVGKHKLKLFECDLLKNEKLFDFLTGELFNRSNRAGGIIQVDIILQCGSAFDPNGEVLMQSEDKVEGKTTIVTISPSSLEWKYKYKYAGENSKKLLNKKFYKDGSMQWSFQVDGIVYNGFRNSGSELIAMNFENDGKIYYHTYDNNYNLIDSREEDSLEESGFELGIWEIITGVKAILSNFFNQR